jgi:diacylglycerol kinase
VAAYLVGSLVQVSLSSLGDGFAALKRNRFRRNWYAALGHTITIEQLLSPPLLEPEAIGWIEGDEQTKNRLRSLTEVQLAASQEDLSNAVGLAEKKVANGLVSVHSTGEGEGVRVAFGIDFKSESEPVVKSFVVAGPEDSVSRDLREEHKLPIYSAARNMFEERGGIKTILMETTAQAGSEVERLYSEAELRFTVALSLAALVITLWVKSGDAWWLALLVAPIGLLLHALILNKHGGLEMVESLRSRDAKELEKIAPAFDRYRSNAINLAKEIEQFKGWEQMASELHAREQDPLVQEQSASV